jgi:hypothetical protein
MAFKIIKSYFSFFNKKLEYYVRTKKHLLNGFRRLSTNRIFLSKGEFKHTNNKVIITLYVYNRQKNNFFLKLRKRFLRKFFKNIISFKNRKFSNLNKLTNKLVLVKKINRINNEGFKYILEAN